MLLFKKNKGSKTKNTKRPRGKNSKTSREQANEGGGSAAGKKRTSGADRRSPELRSPEPSTAATSQRAKKEKTKKTRKSRKHPADAPLTDKPSSEKVTDHHDEPKNPSKETASAPHLSREALTTKTTLPTLSPGTPDAGTTSTATTTTTTNLTTMTTLTTTTTVPPATTMTTLGATITIGDGTDGPAWLGESIANGWMDKADYPKAKQEFDRLQEIVVNVQNDCKKWVANKKLNQSEDYPVLDATLVKSEQFVNMSRIEVPLARNVHIGQIPVTGSEEAFWKAVFDVRAVNIHLLIGEEDNVEFFPAKSGDFMHYGVMFVNNRKVVSVTDDVIRFAIEVLPDGCSNSIICNLTLIKNWNSESVHAKYSSVVKETIELTNFLTASQPDETALIMSKHGAGRAGYFVALSVAVTKMDQKLEPDLFEIVKAIRNQRPRAVESLTQYASLYISMFYYIKRKSSKKIDGDKKAVADPNDPICKKAMQLTATFTNGLIDEANAGRSVMSQLPKPCL
uniref:Tyrosine-protein phosphatase domain-containing protein n=1 Tax=Caenorhabditis japonica TaxID=281687 RepID=A0A8R1I7K9_CAEJA